MGLRSDTRDELWKETVTKIFGQPKDADLTTLEKELIAIAASIPTTLGGGNLGHAGIIVEPDKYLIMTGGISFEPPGNPGVYPAGLAINAAVALSTIGDFGHKVGGVLVTPWVSDSRFTHHHGFADDVVAN